MAHFRIECECGRVLSQCRCQGPKPTHVRRPCECEPEPESDDVARVDPTRGIGDFELDAKDAMLLLRRVRSYLPDPWREKVADFLRRRGYRYLSPLRGSGGCGS